MCDAVQRRGCGQTDLQTIDDEDLSPWSWGLGYLRKSPIPTASLNAHSPMVIHQA